MAEDCGDVLDSWEDQVDSGILDERLKQISVSNSTSAASARAQPVMMQEETGRTEYRPQVRILKREPNSNSNSVGNSPRVAQVNKPLKTLEQREAAYAEARMRIFGEAAEPEPNANDTNSLGAENCVASAASDKPSRMNKVEVRSGNSIIRQPKGPDGSKGFNSDR